MKITSIQMANAIEGWIVDRDRAARDADVATHRVDMCRVYMEADLTDTREPTGDPSPLWHEHVAAARDALGSSASERDVREYAMRLAWGLPPHGAMPPMTPSEWAAGRGLVASWLYRKGMSEEGLERHITDSPRYFYPEDSSPTKVSPGVLVELVRSAYAKSVAESVGAPFITSRALWCDLLMGRVGIGAVEWERNAAEGALRKMLREQGVDLALLRQEEDAARAPWVYVPWETYFSQALAELGPRATEREVNLRAGALEHEQLRPHHRVPWEISLERASMALGEGATNRQLHEYAARVWLKLAPHAGDVLPRGEWVKRQVAYMVSARLSMEFFLNPKAHEELATRIATFSYLDVPKDELAAELLAGFVAGARAEEDASRALQRAEQAERDTARDAAVAQLQAALAAPGAPPIEVFHREACEYRKGGTWKDGSNQ